ncbi:transmembrane protein-like [Tropilaelaps mercedesae]|uniref:Transmembrane protein-like n=1 Tax=Tropilaelaps mercedesae TaxID=418985 RepID=A0A1V9X930_9ACAR|nr:transmembrane protein-like [Tropilaelaps mercedesae]
MGFRLCIVTFRRSFRHVRYGIHSACVRLWNGDASLRITNVPERRPSEIMSDYSYTSPCVCLRLDPKLADELRQAADGTDDAVENRLDRPDYLVQMKGLLNKEQPIPFTLLKNYWRNHKEGVSLVEWTARCRLELPSVVVPPRSDDLEKRCKELRARMMHKEYDSMVASIDRSRASNGDNYGNNLAVWRQLRNQYIAVVNTVLTIGGTFAFFYKAVEYSLPERNVAAQVLAAILACLVVAVAELYFLLRSL